MKQFAHFFIGSEFSDVVAETGRYVFKNGGGDAASSINLFLVDNAGGSSISVRKLECSSSATDEILAGFDKNIVLDWEEENVVKTADKEALSEFYIKKVFDRILNVNNRGDNAVLHIVLHLPLYKPEALETAKLLYEMAEGAERPVEIDFMGYCDDVADVIEPEFKIEHPSRKQIAVFAKYRASRNMSFNRHFVAIQNTLQNGISLGLTPRALSEVVGCFAMLCADYYDEIFPNTVEYKDVVSIGLSTLCLDKYLFTEYLLGKTILNVMDNAQVNVSDVDVNVACDTAHSLLKNKVSILSDFWNRTEKTNEDEQSDIVKIQQEFDNDISRIIESCRERLLSDKSITSKAAIMAAVLARTECELFSRSIFNRDAASIDDLFSEPIDFYVDYNKSEYYTIEGEAIVNPVKELKEVCVNLINSEAEIRDLQGQLASLEKQVSDNRNVEECYLEDGFYHFRGNKYRLLPKVDEIPLEETYEAHEVGTPSIDLRTNFSAIKNQGQQGSCLAFSVTSMFEYILKLNHAREFDLSEAFLYYNSRHLDDTGDVDVTTDTGSRFRPAIESLHKFGIALEKFCKYDEGVYDRKPSAEAYADAANRKLLKAMNVKRTVGDVKSALTDGYPVAVSFNLCESFSHNCNGFISMPSEDEIAKIVSGDAPKERHSSHAMVIVGFSDELQMFVVRNSWGVEWGDNGYCYVPYDYVDNEHLCNFSCILTQVQSMVAHMEHIPSLKVDNSDLTIRYFITKASLDKELEEADAFRAHRDYLRLYFEKVKKLLSSPNGRDGFIEATREKLLEEQVSLRDAKREHEDKQEAVLAEFNTWKRSMVIKAAGAAIVVAFLFWVYNSFVGLLEELPVTSEPHWWQIGIGTLIIIGMVIFRKSLPMAVFLAGGITIAFFGIRALIVFLSPRLDGYDISWLWLVAPLAIIVGIVAYTSHKRWKEWREQRDALDVTILHINKSIVAKEKEIQTLKIKTFAAWTLLKALEKLQAHFLLIYGNYISLINNLRAWYHEVADYDQAVILETTAPNTTLLSKEKLDRFFDTKLKDNRMFEIDLSENIENYEMSENYLRSYKEALFNLIARNVMSHPGLAEFDIAAHIVDNRFPDTAIEVTRSLIDQVDSQSDLFLHINASERGEIIRSTGIYVPSLNIYRDSLRKKLGRYSEPYFESSDRYRLAFVKTATLWFRECVNLNPDRAVGGKQKS